MLTRKQKKNRIYEDDLKDVEIRHWAFFVDFQHTPEWQVKMIHVNEGGVLSLQRHRKREEHWFVVEGAIIAERWFGDIKDESILKVGHKMVVEKGIKHRMSAYKGDAVVIETSLGLFDEKDIKRFSDKYGRK